MTRVIRKFWRRYSTIEASLMIFYKMNIGSILSHGKLTKFLESLIGLVLKVGSMSLLCVSFLWIPVHIKVIITVNKKQFRWTIVVAT